MTQTAKDYLDLLCSQTPDPAHWDWEATLEQCYSHCLDPGAAIVDIGAHTGRHARVFRDRLQASPLWLVEPLPDEYRELTKQFGDNPQARLVNKALSSAPGQARFTVNVAAKEESGLRRRHYNDEAGARVKEIDVEIGTLDLLLEEDKAQRLDFIKIDVEGAELDVLAGSDACVQRFRPLISVEFGAPGYSVYDRQPEELFTLAERWDYTLCDLLGHPVSNLQEWLKVVDAYYWDYLMVPTEKLSALQARLAGIAGPIPVGALGGPGREGQAVSELDHGSLPTHLNLSGDNVHASDVLHIASHATTGAHLIADAVDLAMLPAQQFAHIQSGDRLTYLPPARTDGALREWNRLLAADGALQIAVPDLVTQGVQLQSLDEMSGEHAAALLDRVYGGSVSSGARLTGFSQSRLVSALENCGFSVAKAEVSDGLLHIEAHKTHDVTDGAHAYLRSISDPETLVSEAYLLLLGRAVDPEGLGHYRDALEAQSLSRSEFIAALCGCEEYQQRKRLLRALG